MFLKAIAQYNYRHYFKLECYIYLLVSYNHLNKINTKTDNIYIYISKKDIKIKFLLGVQVQLIF